MCICYLIPTKQSIDGFGRPSLHRPLFRKSQEVAGNKPKVLISDGARNFAEAHKKEFRTLAKPHSIHIRHIHLKRNYNNNRMERLNGKIRDREKVMRGLKKEDSPIIIGMRIHHNFIRSHMALDGKTPSQACGIEIQGSHKWLTLIQNTSTNKT